MQRRGEGRKEGREKNQFSWTEAGWSSGGLKEEEEAEEEERTYFPVITRLSNLESWRGRSQQPRSSDLFLGAMDSLLLSLAAMSSGQERTSCTGRRKNTQNDKANGQKCM